MAKPNPILDVFPEMEISWKDNLPLRDDYLNLLTQDIPMIDLRAPIEFNEGAYPFAFSLPLMSDEERHLIGICYKEKGQKEAIKLGNQLVSGTLKEQRIEAWKKFVEKHPTAVMYCFRGGMRSQISQMWLDQAGIKIERIKGGYKALRRFLIDSLDELVKQDFIVVGGLTGIGKTHFIHQYKKNIDLEGLANHKGSAFGRSVDPQPKPIAFENELIIDLLKKQSISGSYLVEDEGRRVGILTIPVPLSDRLADSPIVLLKADIEQRVQTVYQDYILTMLKQAEQKYGKEEGYSYFSSYLLESLSRIKKRLGGVRHKYLMEQLSLAVEHKDDDKFCIVIESLMTDYYDPMYSYQLSQKKHNIVFEGVESEIMEYLSDKVELK